MHTRPLVSTDVGQTLEATSFVVTTFAPQYIAYPDDDLFICVPSLLTMAMALPRMNVIITSASWMKNFEHNFFHPDGNFLFVSVDVARHIMAEGIRKDWTKTYTYGTLYVCRYV